MQQRPRILSIEQVVLVPAPSDSAKAAARATAQMLLDSISAGGDFQELAKEYSDDPGSAVQGGDLGWFRPGTMVREFEDAAFALLDGQVSDVVETEFGFHIIKVERSRVSERMGRHILIRAELGQADLARTRTRADTVLELARTGTPMDDLFDRFSDPLAPDTLTVAFEQLAQLPPGYDAMLRSAVEGEVVGPLEYQTAPGETRFAVVRVKSIREAGAYTFEDVKAQLADQLQRQKQVEGLLARLRAKSHVDIRLFAGG